jgi:hypothetical protein
MPETITLLALFKDLEPAAVGIDRLHQYGLPDDQIYVLSGVPVLEQALGRPKQHTIIPLLALAGAIGGFLLGLFFTYGTSILFPITVGGQPILPIPPGIIVTAILALLGMLVFAFLGVFFESYLPSYGPMNYIPAVSDGKIAVQFTCPTEEQPKFVQAMTDTGAESVEVAEAKPL